MRKQHKGWFLGMMAVLVVISFYAADFFFSAKKEAFPTHSGNDTLAVLKAAYKRPKEVPFPVDNPYSDAKANLGKMLFFETRISRSGMVSCATCHNPAHGWTNGNPKGVGDFHQVLDRRDPVIPNLAWDDLFFWDGRAEGLEEQALNPIRAEKEMNMQLEEAVTRLKSIKGYEALFKAAFPEAQEPITSENIAKAIATFERTVISGEAPFDRWIEGNETAISEAAKQGFVLFNQKANCASCHSGWRFSDGSFHDIGMPDNDIGRGRFLPLLNMQHAFKTMGLRNIADRASYMHDGSLKTLEEVIDHYDNGFVRRESLSDEIKPLGLTPEEKENLVEFLKTLTGKDAPVTIPELPR